jgi:thioredoxin 1
MKNETPAVTRLAPRRRVRSDWVQSTSTGTFAKLVLEGEGASAVEFISYGCAQCRVIEAVLQQVAAMVKSKGKIFRVNIAVEPELAERHQIPGSPTLIMFLDGIEVRRVEGLGLVVSTLLTVVRQP